MRRVTVLIAILLVVSAPHASAGEMLDEAVRSLRIDPVYVHPQADPTLGAEEAQRLRDRISVSSIPVFVAVLPSWAADEAGGTDALPRAIGVALDRTGAVAVVAGRSFRAGASAGVGLEGGQAGRLAAEAFEAFHPAELGLEPMLADFVGRLDGNAQAVAPAPMAPPDAVRGLPDVDTRPMPYQPTPGPGSGFMFIFVIFAILIVASWVWQAFKGQDWSTPSVGLSSPLRRPDEHHRRHGSGWPFGGSTFGSSGSSTSRSGDWGSSGRGGSGDWGGSSSSRRSSGSTGSSGSGGGDW